MIHFVMPVVVTFVIASSTYSHDKRFDVAFFDQVFAALLASVTTSIGLWIVS